MIRKYCWTIILVIFTFVFFPYVVFAAEPLTLEESIGIALENSITVNIAKEGSKSATAQKKAAFTDFLPKFSTYYNYTRLNETPFSRFEGLPPGPLYSLNGMEIPVGTQSNYNWAFEVKQPLYAGGGIMANYQANIIGEKSAHLEEIVRYQDVVQEVKVAYFNVLRAQKIEVATKQSVEMLSAHRDIAQNYFDVGMIPKNDLLHAEVELANGKQALIIAQNTLELTKYYFTTILRRDFFTPVDVVDILNYHPLKQSLQECLGIARKTRPELKISSLKIQQAGKMVRVVQSEYMPTVSLMGNYTRFGDDMSVSGSNYKDMESWYVMAVASWNFWEWGKTKYKVEASKARENQAIDTAKQLDDNITLEVTNAYLKLKETENQIIVSKKVIEQAEENFRISEERYKERISTSTDVLEAQTLLTKAKSEYANALGDYNINYAKLQKAMGTIWGTDEETLNTGEKYLKTDKVDVKASDNVNLNTDGKNLRTDNLDVKTTNIEPVENKLMYYDKDASDNLADVKTIRNEPSKIKFMFYYDDSANL